MPVYQQAFTSRRFAMLFALIHLLAGTVLAGVFVTVVVSVPALYDMGMRAIPVAVLAGVLLAFPVAWYVTKAIRNEKAKPAP
jgi:hypothetical protein